MMSYWGKRNVSKAIKNVLPGLAVQTGPLLGGGPRLVLGSF